MTDPGDRTEEFHSQHRHGGTLAQAVTSAGTETLHG